VVSEQRHVISIANNGYLKKNYNQKADEFQNEASAKSIQKALRKDLTRLLCGDVKIFNAGDEEGDEEERKSFFPEIRFIWSFGSKSETSESKKPAANREVGNPSSKGKKNRYHISRVSNHTAEENDVPVETKAAGTLDTDPAERR
jgi:hypothetical protein